MKEISKEENWEKNLSKVVGSACNRFFDSRKMTRGTWHEAAAQKKEKEGRKKK